MSGAGTAGTSRISCRTLNPPGRQKAQESEVLQITSFSRHLFPRLWQTAKCVDSDLHFAECCHRQHVHSGLELPSPFCGSGQCASGSLGASTGPTRLREAEPCPSPAGPLPAGMLLLKRSYEENRGRAWWALMFYYPNEE